MNSIQRSEPATRWKGPATIAFFVVLTLLCAGAFSPSSALDETVYNCLLTGLQEVGPNASPAIGGGQFLIDTDANTVTYHISFTGLVAAETAAHIHGFTDPGVNAGVLVGLPAGNPKIGVWAYAEADEAGILAGKTYVNIHSAAFPAGEIRGQIVPLNAFIDEAQEVPPTGSAAIGWGTFVLDIAAEALHYYISFGGLGGAETAAHIHGFAGHGFNAGVKHGLPAGSPKVGTWFYDPVLDLPEILEGKTYVNIHSAVAPAGEIRGQIVPIVVPIDGSQEIPPNGTAAAGVGLISINTADDILGYDIVYAGFTTAETAAHIHGYAPPGAPAGIVHTLPAGLRKLGTWVYPAADEPEILDGLSYINIHSSMFPSGEIRGQIRGFCPVPAAAPDPTIPVALRVSGNEPNPFREATAIRFQLAGDAEVRVSVFDSGGRLVRSIGPKTMSAGEHRVAWDGRNAAGDRVPNGVYHYLVESPEMTTTGHMTIVR